MKTRIYIIGSVPLVIDQECEDRFYKTQRRLWRMGFDVVNPIVRLTDNSFSLDDAKRKNYQDLMLSQAVYVMPCVELVKGVKNLEIKFAFDFNLTFISGMLDLSVDEMDIG